MKAMTIVAGDLTNADLIPPPEKVQQVKEMSDMF